MRIILLVLLALVMICISGCNTVEEIAESNETVPLVDIPQNETISYDKIPANISENNIITSRIDDLLLSQTDNSNGNLYLFDGRSLIAQSFRFNFSVLTRAFFLSYLPMKANKNPKSQVILHIRKGSVNGEEITNVTKNMKDINDSDWVEWNFPYVTINRSMMYFFVFECPDCKYVLCTANVGSSCGSTNEDITFLYQKSDVYTEGNYWYKGFETDYIIKPEYDWDLAFKIYGIK